MFKEYKNGIVLARRIFAVSIGILLFPFVAFLPVKAQVYSYIHKLWLKQGTKPVWLSESEKAVGPVIDF